MTIKTQINTIYFLCLICQAILIYWLFKNNVVELIMPIAMFSYVEYSLQKIIDKIEEDE